MELIAHRVEEYAAKVRERIESLRYLNVSVSTQGGHSNRAASARSGGEVEPISLASAGTETRSLPSLTSLSTVDIFSGLRGKTCLWWEASTVDAYAGLKIHGYDTAGLGSVLLAPSTHSNSSPLSERKEPFVESLLLLLLTGTAPKEQEVEALRIALESKRNEASHMGNRHCARDPNCCSSNNNNLPDGVRRAVQAQDPNTPVLSLLSIGLLALQPYSSFQASPLRGSKKGKYSAQALGPASTSASKQVQGEEPPTVTDTVTDTVTETVTVTETEPWKAALHDVLLVWALLPALCGVVLRHRRTRAGSGRGAGGRRRRRSGCGGGGSGGGIGQRGPQEHAALVAAELLDFSTPLLIDFCSLYIRLHCDHGGGNASAHTSHLVSSTGANIFAAMSAAFLALEGPLHGGANGDALRWMNIMCSSAATTSATAAAAATARDDCGGRSTCSAAEGLLLGGHSPSPLPLPLPLPSDREVYAYAVRFLRGQTETNGQGQKRRIIPGFGHAVLRCIDPRATALLSFARSRQPLSSHRSVVLAHIAVPAITEALKTESKARSPFPNVDAVSGLALQAVRDVAASTNLTNRPEQGQGQGQEQSHGSDIAEVEDIGMLLFALSRACGIGAQLVLERAVRIPLERPGSMTSAEMHAAAATTPHHRSKL